MSFFLFRHSLLNNDICTYIILWERTRARFTLKSIRAKLVRTYTHTHTLYWQKPKRTNVRVFEKRQITEFWLNYIQCFIVLQNSCLLIARISRSSHFIIALSIAGKIQYQQQIHLSFLSTQIFYSNIMFVGVKQNTSHRHLNNRRNIFYRITFG